MNDNDRLELESQVAPFTEAWLKDAMTLVIL